MFGIYLEYQQCLEFISNISNVWNSSRISAMFGIHLEYQQCLEFISNVEVSGFNSNIEVSVFHR